MPYAIRVHAYGGPEEMKWEEGAVGEPGPGQIRIRHTAVGLNFIDVYHRTGLYKTGLPLTPGSEAAGIVEAVGEGVSDLKIGDRVGYCGGPPGSYPELRLFPADRVVKLPDWLEESTAAAMFLQGMTARYLLRKTFPVRRGDVVLIQAAAGGVGLIASQWANALGATVIGTVGSAEKAALARDHGCHHTILYRDEDVAARCRELTGGRGVDVVYDGVGKDTFRGSLDSLRLRGTLVSFGNASGPVEPISPLLLGEKGGLFLTRPALGHYIGTKDELLETAADLFGVVKEGRVKIQVHQSFALKDAAAAHRALEGRQTTGSTVLLP